MSLARDPAEQRPKGMHPIEFEALREAQAKEER